MSGGITGRMNSELREAITDKLYRDERSYRDDKLVEKWNRIPEVGKNIKKLDEGTARLLARHLENQARFMGRLTEAQLSSGFQGFSPENMLRLVRLAYPNTIRNKLFTEFAMESAKDSIKYIRPVYTTTANGQNLNDRTFGVPGWSNAGDAYDPADPWNLNGSNDINNSDYRRAMYETNEDRYTNPMANALVATFDGTHTWTVYDSVKAVQTFSAVTDTSAVANVGGTTLTLNTTGTWVIYGTLTIGTTHAAVGSSAFSLGYVDGYASLFTAADSYPPSAGTGWHLQEQNVIATQNKTGAALSVNGSWMIKSGSTLTITATSLVGVFALGGADAANVRGGYGRFNPEGDFQGNFLGEVELIMTDYWFRPQPTTIGVTWSQLTELVLDTSFGVAAEELLVDYAGQEIKRSLDVRAVKIAYQAAKMNPSYYTITFDASSGNSTDDSYLSTAQTFTQAIARVADVQLNDINRGGVSRMVGGPAAMTYLRMVGGFSAKGQMTPVGGHQIGELQGIPLFKVPSNVIPDDEILCVWKNDENEADVAVAFGTLVPFFSTGIIQRKNFYKEAGLSTYGDWNVLNRRYLGLIKITGLRQLQN